MLAIWTVTNGHLDPYPVEDARRFVDGFIEYVEARHAEVLAAIRDVGKLDDDTLATLGTAVADYAQSFVATGAGEGSESGIGRTTPTDPVKPDVGWDRMSSADDDDEAPAG